MVIVGHSLIFIKQSTRMSLQEKLNQVFAQSVLLIQRVGRGYGRKGNLIKGLSLDSSRQGISTLRRERIRAEHVAIAARRVEREKPLREALERERHQMHGVLSNEARDQLLALQRRTSRSSKVLQRCDECKTELYRTLSDGLNLIRMVDDDRLKTECAAKARDEQERTLEEQRKQAVHEERKRASAQRAAAQQAKNQKEALATLKSKRGPFDEKSMSLQIASQKQVALRAKADVEAAQLSRWEASYESQSLAAARRKIRESLPLRGHPTPSRPPSRAINEVHESAAFQVQRDIWSLWEQK